MDQTERELKNKLREAGYPECIIDKTLDYVKSYGYINDSRYAANFIRARKVLKVSWRSGHS
jgi:regulatory protein